MKQIELKKLAEDTADKIRRSKVSGCYHSEPFQYVVIDNFLPTSIATMAMEAFPPMTDPSWDHSNDPGIEVKSRSKWGSEFDIPENISDVVRVCNSAVILHAISDILSIPKLLPDPFYSGGGLNVSETNGHLDVHIDGNYHDASGLNRRVNLLIYLNPNWQPSWGGEFGIYAENSTDLVATIPPVFNRCVIFDSHDKSYHGLPNPIKFPKNEPRKSIILYYYTVAKRPNHLIEIDEPHSALWRSKGLLDKSGNKKRKYT